MRTKRWAATAVLMSLTARAAAGEPVTPASYDRAVEDFRALLTALVAADTTNPPGNEARAVAIVATRLDAEKIPHRASEFAPGRQNLVARLRGDGSERPLLVLAHLDVVGAEGQPWTSDPHQVTEKDGFLVGRGVSDDLGMAVMGVETLVLLQRSGTKLRRDVILALTGDEESGGAGIRWQLEHDFKSIDAEIAINEGGGIRLEDGGRRALLIGLQTAEKTYQDFAIGAKGPTGHSSVPLADNAIYRLARALERIGAHRFPDRLLPVTREYFAGRAAVERPEIAAAMREVAGSKDKLPAKPLGVLKKNPILAALLHTTCVATTVHGGTRENALPADARANVNCRILPDEQIEDVRKKLVEVASDPDITIEPVDSFGAGPPSALAGPFPEALKKIAGETWPGIPIIPALSMGATDSRFLRGCGIAAYGLSPIAMTEQDARRAHGIDERIPIASLRPGIEFFHRLILELAEKR